MRQEEDLSTELTGAEGVGSQRKARGSDLPKPCSSPEEPEVAPPSLEPSSLLGNTLTAAYTKFWLWLS